jgi:AcrR family transcriptional regulator
MRGKANALSEPAAPGETRNGNGVTAHELSRERVTEIQRVRILAAMVEEVSMRGAANVTVAHVVGRSGVSRRTFYELFTDGEDCFLAAFDEAVHRVTSVVLAACAEHEGWRSKTRAALTELLELLGDDPGTGRLLIVESLGAGATVLERRRLVLARIIDAVDRGRTEAKRGGGPPPLTAEGVVGGVLSVLHARLLACSPPAMGGPGMGEREAISLLELTGPLMSMIVLPYLGRAAAQRELLRPVPRRRHALRTGPADPLRDVAMRLTYRTVRVLTAVAEHPGSSNRTVGIAAGMQDQGQISKLLSRLHHLGLIENAGVGPSKGAPNAWALTAKGRDIEAAIAQRVDR